MKRNHGRTAAPAVMLSLAALTLAALALPTGSAGAETAESPAHRSFKDWEVGCDNTRRCTAIGLQPEDGAGVTAFLRIERPADALAAPTIGVVLAKEGLAPGDPITLLMDGAPIDGVSSSRTVDALMSELAYPAVIPAASEVTPLIQALRSGKRLQLASVHGPEAEVSLDGAVAALLFIDDVQGRIDTVTALIRKGERPPSAVPAPPPLPTLRPQKPADAVTVPAGLAGAVSKQQGDGSDCERKEEPRAYALGEGRTLVALPCGDGAYNFATEYFIVEGDDPKRARPAVLPQPGGPSSQRSSNTLFGSEVDSRTGQISFFSRGRGPGDCGARGVYAWTGQEFAVVSFRAMDTCRGVPEPFWPVLWRSAPAPGDPDATPRPLTPGSLPGR
ncbi:MAG: DUF1176 domain-containing protein [Rhodospirillales bacterium]